MKISRLFGAIALCLALAFVVGCPGGQLRFDGQADAGSGETIELESGDDGATLTSQPTDPICAPNVFLPAGMDAYAQLRPNGIFDRRIPFVYNLYRDVILSEEDLPLYDDYYFGGERGNIWAIFRTIFDDKLREAAGVGLGDIDCISLAIQSRTGDFCQDRTNPCFNTWDNVQRNLENIPFIGPYLAQVMVLFPVQYRNLFPVFQTIQIPDPFVLFRELTSGDLEIMMVMDWEPGALVKFKDFMEWAQLVINGEDPDRSMNLPPEFALMAETTPTITWGALEDYEGCFTAALGAKASGVMPAVVGDGDSNLVIWACEAGDYLLLASSESGMNELLGQYELIQQNIAAASFLNDPAYRQTYKALWDRSVAVPDLLVAAKFHQLQDNLVGQLNNRSESAKYVPILGPLDQFLPVMNDDIDMFTVGAGMTLDQKSKVNITLQLNDTANLDNPIYTLGKQVSGDGEIEGYYDYRFSFGADASSTAIDSIDMDFYMSADQLGLPVDGFNAVATMLMAIEEQILDSYIDSRNQ